MKHLHIGALYTFISFASGFAQGETYIKKFEDTGINEIGLVGGKNASLGEMISNLTRKGVRVPSGFAITVDGYWHFMKSNNLLTLIEENTSKLSADTDFNQLREVGLLIRSSIENAEFPEDLRNQIVAAYKELSKNYGAEACDVAVRSSATAEDLPDASFAGQQDTYLNIKGVEKLIHACKKCFASLFTDRALSYRQEKGFSLGDIALSIGVQKMARSDLGAAGVMFTLDTETGNNDIIVINSAFGLGEGVVQGSVSPDEFRLHKPTFKKGHNSLIKKEVGSKHTKMVYTHGESTVGMVDVSAHEKSQFSLTDDEVYELATAALVIEDHYSARKGSLCPMDIEWAKDGLDGKLYILQARPETVHSLKDSPTLKLYTLQASDSQLDALTIVQGQSIGQQIVHGTARRVDSLHDAVEFKEGDILVTSMTDPDWVPLMKKAAGLITDRGGRTCHAAIVSRELGIPALVGTEHATEKIVSGQKITLDCSKGKVGYVYDGTIPFDMTEIDISNLSKPSAKLFVNIADPDRAFAISLLPSDGVGLARLEFIVSTMIKIHPMAALFPERVTDSDVIDQVNDLAKSYADVPTYFTETLAQSVGSIAAAFYPRPVIVRLSDFKSNEYRNLIGGTYFEPQEENPMMGVRGASRYYSDLYAPAFALECAAMKKVRDEMGFTNVKLMIPFVRTPDEGKKVLHIMESYGLTRGINGLEVIMMCEIPSNVILIDKFSEIFDGFSIGSNDLTQMTLAVDRDSGILTKMFDERDEAVQKMLGWAIKGAKRNNRYIGICGQAPSDFPEIADFLIASGIDSVSLNPDSLLPFMIRHKDQ